MAGYVLSTVCLSGFCIFHDSSRRGPSGTCLTPTLTCATLAGKISPLVIQRRHWKDFLQFAPCFVLFWWKLKACKQWSSKEGPSRGQLSGVCVRERKQERGNKGAAS